MKYSEVLKIYLNSGVKISEEQYNLLSSSLKNSYLRKRSVSGYEDWEFKYINDNQKINYIEKEGENLEYDDIFYLVKYSDNKDEIALKIIDAKGEKLEYDDIFYLLKHSHNKDDIASKIIDAKGEKLDFTNMSHLLQYSKNKDDIITKIIEKKGKKLYYGDINYLITNSINKDDIITKIIDIRGEKLYYDDIFYLLQYSKNKELIKKTLLQNGVDYKTINYVITNNQMNTSLIPDNYQSMLQEIRRIKEIML